MTGTSATFTDALSPAKAQAAASAGKTGYVLTVAGPGLATSTTSITAGDISSAPLVSGTPTVTESPTLTAEGYLTGSAVGIIVPVTSGTTAPTGATEPLAGATVTATLTSSTTCPTGTGGYAGKLTATTDTTGDFTIVGDPSAAPANGGLCVGGSYTVTVAATGFTSNSATFTAAAGSNSPGALDPIDLSAKQITQVIDVTGLAGGVNVTVTASSLVGPTVTQSATVAKHTTSVSFTFTLDPTPYSFTVQAANYETVTVGPLPYTPGFTPQTQTVQLPTEVNTVSGTVSLADGTSTVAIGNLPLTLVPNAGNGATPVGTTTTASDGTYSFSNIPNGSYVIEVGDGYSVSPTPTFSTDYPNPVVENFTVSATPVPVNVAVSTSGHRYWFQP